MSRTSEPPTQSTAEASPEAQVDYLMKLLKFRDQEIATLRLRLKTGKLEAELESDRVQRRLEALYEIADDMKKRVKPAQPVPVEVVAWLRYCARPWWWRLFHRYRGES